MPFPWDSSGALEAESQGQRECWAATNALGLALQNGFNMTSQSQVQETLPRLGFDLDDTPLHGTIPVGQWAAVPGASTSAPPLVQSRLDGSCGQMNRSDPGVLEYVQQPWHDVDRQTALGTWVDAILPNGQMDENPTQELRYSPYQRSAHVDVRHNMDHANLLDNPCDRLEALKADSQYSSEASPPMVSPSPPTDPLPQGQTQGALNGIVPDTLDPVGKPENWCELVLGKSSGHGRQARRRPFQNTHLRQETARTRKIGSCLRCRKQRLRVPGRLPCLRYRIKDMQLYMPDEDLVLNWTLDCFGHGKPRTGKTAVVGISQALGNQRIVLRVHKHGAEDHDAADAGAQAAAVTQQPLSLVDHDEARRAVANYIPGVTGEAFRRFLGPPDGLPNKTFRQACALYKDPATPPEITQLIRQLFTVWTASRIVSMPAFLVGDGVAGTTQPPRCAGQLPPLLALQLKAILTNYIRGSLRSDVLRRMQAVIYGRQECPWLVAYLTTFILLHNTSLLVAFEVGSLGKDAMTNQIHEASIRQYHADANNLLGHFHYYTKGHYPFSASCSDLILHADLGLDSAEIDFVYESRRLIAQQARCLGAPGRRGQVACQDVDCLVGQLYRGGWRPQEFEEFLGDAKRRVAAGWW
ncbi:uncharacterized protein UV8b_07609 [Ustilaginoidea virens]|uniref:Uncharacterized protein n=1 Tax=Ustilaginoidea virens TaxID=1159556 RepID=A0A8E5HXK5_USTVR|nr:uncharacterized protein UV8b_07609 [Ustilaginoidea virens]QUC23368.1 hypothetical protein UV8b_07609 [Ustilaginoidea virens]